MNAIQPGQIAQPLGYPPAVEESSLLQRICALVAQAFSWIVSFFSSCCIPEQQEAPQPQVRPPFSFPRGFRFEGRLRLLNEGEAQPVANYRGSGRFRNLWDVEAMEAISLKTLDSLWSARKVNLSIDSFGEYCIDAALTFGAQAFYIRGQGETAHQPMAEVQHIQDLVGLSGASPEHCMGAILHRGQEFHTLYVDTQAQRYYHFDPQGEYGTLKVCGSLETFMNHLQPVLQGDPWTLTPYQRPIR